MGLYTTSFALYGCKTTSIPQNLPKYIEVFSFEGIHVVYARSTLYRFPSVDSILEKEEIERGYVTMEAYLKASNNRSLTPRPKEAKYLSTLQGVEVSTWFMETTFSTLEYPPRLALGTFLEIKDE